MELRAQRVPRFRSSEFIGDPDTTSSTDLHPYRWAGNRHAAVAIGQRVHDVHKVYRPTSRTGGALWLFDPHTRSWATVTLVDEPPYPVEQGGWRHLFDEVADAYRWWQQAGEPAVTDWTVTVGPDGQRIALPD